MFADIFLEAKLLGQIYMTIELCLYFEYCVLLLGIFDYYFLGAFTI